MWVLFALVALLSALRGSLSSITWRWRTRILSQENHYNHSCAGEVCKEHGKKGDSKEPAALQLGNMAACSTRFGRELWGKTVLTSLTQPWACCLPSVRPKGARKGNERWEFTFPSPQQSPLPPAFLSAHLFICSFFPFSFPLIWCDPVPSFLPLIPFCFLTPVLLPNPVSLPWHDNHSPLSHPYFPPTSPSTLTSFPLPPPSSDGHGPLTPLNPPPL